MGVGRNLYVDIAAFAKHFMRGNALDATDASEIERVIEAASRQVDEHVRRPEGFFATTATRYFDGNGLDYLPVPDLLAATSVKLDEDGDRAFEVTLVDTADYYLRRSGGEEYADQVALPATELLLDAVNGQRSYFTKRPRLVEIAGRWGYTEATEIVNASLGESIDADEIENQFDVSDDTVFAPGQTLLIGSEQMYVLATSASPSPNLTVVRAVNGTEVEAHDTLPVIYRFVYLADIREATLILAGRMWKRRASGYTTQVAGTPLAGGMDPVAERLLAPYVRWSSMVA